MSWIRARIYLTHSLTGLQTPLLGKGGVAARSRKSSRFIERADGVVRSNTNNRWRERTPSLLLRPIGLAGFARPSAPVKITAQRLFGGAATPPLPRRGFTRPVLVASHVLPPCILLLLLILLPLHLFAAETPIPDSPTRWVTDTVGFMPVPAAEQLNARLQAYEQQTGHQLLVWIGSTTGDAPIEDWAVRAFEKWKVGRKGIDDGLVLFIMAQDRKLRIEVGYGLEGDVPDAIAFRVIDQTLTPGIQSGDTGGAVTAGMEQLADAIGMPLPGSASTPRPARNQREPLTLFQLLLYGVFGLIALFVLATNPSLAIWLLANVLAGGGHRHRGGWGGGGGSWGGGGGFSGGGGRSGGGGASGSW
jgi:uncharacterized protein